MSTFVGADTREIYERARLLVDLDEACDPDGPTTLLLVVGLRRLGDGWSPDVLGRLRTWFTAFLGDAGTTYSTRSTELCALVEPGWIEREIRNVLAAVRGVAGLEIEPAWGVVELPTEADDAVAALALVDRRLTEAYGPIGYS